MSRVHTAFSTVYTEFFSGSKAAGADNSHLCSAGLQICRSYASPPHPAWICMSWGDLYLYTYCYNSRGKWNLDLFVLTIMELQYQSIVRRILTLWGSVSFCRETLHHRISFRTNTVFCLPFCVLRPSLSVYSVVKLYCLSASTNFQFCGEADTNCLEQTTWRHSGAG